MTLQAFIKGDPTYGLYLNDMHIESNSVLDEDEFTCQVNLKFIALRNAIYDWIDTDAICDYQNMFREEDIEVGKQFAEKADSILSIKRDDLEILKTDAHIRLIEKAQEEMLSMAGISAEYMGRIEGRESDYFKKTVDDMIRYSDERVKSEGKWIGRDIILTEEDMNPAARKYAGLIEGRSTLNIYDFRLSQQEINKASNIIFIDGNGNIKVFKARSDSIKRLLQKSDNAEWSGWKYLITAAIIGGLMLFILFLIATIKI